ncbi:MAG: c-type cytochrome domain-containing protein, partial [Acidobacteriota bacterium]
MKLYSVMVGIATVGLLGAVQIRSSAQAPAAAPAVRKAPTTPAAARATPRPAGTAPATSRPAATRPTATLARAAVPAHPAPPPTEAAFSAVTKTLFNETCGECHNENELAGGFDIGEYHSLETLASDRDRWELILRKLESGEMPPPEVERPEAQINALVKFL